MYQRADSDSTAQLSSVIDRIWSDRVCTITRNWVMMQRDTQIWNDIPWRVIADSMNQYWIRNTLHMSHVSDEWIVSPSGRRLKGYFSSYISWYKHKSSSIITWSKQLIDINIISFWSWATILTSRFYLIASFFCQTSWLHSLRQCSSQFPQWTEWRYKTTPSYISNGMH